MSLNKDNNIDNKANLSLEHATGVQVKEIKEIVLAILQISNLYGLGHTELNTSSVPLNISYTELIAFLSAKVDMKVKQQLTNVDEKTSIPFPSIVKLKTAEFVVIHKILSDDQLLISYCLNELTEKKDLVKKDVFIKEIEAITVLEPLDSNVGLIVDKTSEHLEAVDNWKEIIIHISKYYRLDYSEENIRLTSIWSQSSDSDELIKLMAKCAGLFAKFVPIKSLRLNNWIMPIAIEMDDGEIVAITSISKNNQLSVIFNGNAGVPVTIEKEKLFKHAVRAIFLRPIANAPDPRVDDYIKPVDKHWLWKIVFRDMKPYKHVMIASFIINILGLVGITYSMQTYDRIIPAHSYSTMGVLVTGVFLAFTLDYTLRLLRYHIIDLLGKKADLRISDLVFGHTLRVKNSFRPTSTGTFINQVKDLEQVREMITSSTVVTITDLPFFFFFVWVIYMVGGIVCIVPIIGFILMVLPGILSQKKLEKLANASMRESTLRSAMLVEAVQGLDDIKSLQAEYRFQQQWNHFTDTTASSSLELKHLTHKLMTWAYIVQNSVFVGVVCMGTPLAINGFLTTGALVASSILSSRMMAPVSQIANLLTRWQQTKVAIKGLEGILDLPTDSPEFLKKVHCPNVAGNYDIEKTSFKYRQDSKLPALYINKLIIKPGEKIALLGRNGAGKSSLLNALYGNMFYEEGSVLVDNLAMDLIDPTDLRRDIGYLTQNSRLFFGSIRDNLTLGAPFALDEEILTVLKNTGALDFINKLPDGMNHIIQEGGLGLSGGQRQLLLVSRTLIRNPSIVLLDEPTASLDDLTELEFVRNMETWLQNKTAIISTHKKRILDIVDRVIVVSNGEILIDEPKNIALKIISGDNS